MSNQMQLLPPFASPKPGEMAFLNKREVFNPLSKTEYLRNPKRDFKKKCFEMNANVKQLFSARLGSLNVESVKPLSLLRLEKGLRKYFFGEYGIITQQDKDLKRMYQYKRALNKQRDRKQSYHLDKKNAKIIITRRFISNKRVKSNSPHELIENKNKKNSNNVKVDNNCDSNKPPLFATGIKMTNQLQAPNSKEEQTGMKYVKNFKLTQFNQYLSKKVQGRNIKSNLNFSSECRTNYNNEALSVDNAIKCTENTECNKKHNIKLTRSNDSIAYSQLFQTQHIHYLNTTYSSTRGITPKGICASMHRLKMSLSEASNRLIPKLIKVDWTKYDNYSLVNLKTQDDKEKEKDLENLLDIKVDFNNKKQICDEFNRRLNNKEYLDFSKAVKKFAKEIGHLHPDTTLKLNERIKDDYFKQTRASKYSRIIESSESHKKLMTNLRCKMSKHYSQVSKLIANYNHIKNKIFAS